VSATAPQLGYTFSEYVRFEEDAREKHEFFCGSILAMAGGTLEHSRIANAVSASLTAQLRGKRCVVLESNARVRVRATGNAYYPDASVVCGEITHDQNDRLSLSNPSVLVEVLSPSTALFDRTEKLADYQLIPSLQHIVHVSHEQQSIDVWSRQDGRWECASFGPGQLAELPAIGCQLDVAETYRDPLAPA
jgi:Uma2 family endonuclease